MIALSLQSIANHPWLVALGWAILHFVWQATLISIAVAVISSFFSKQSAQIRYWIPCTGLLLMIAIPVVTYGIYLQIEPSYDQQQLARTPASLPPQVIETSEFIPVTGSSDEAAQILIESVTEPSPGVRESTNDMARIDSSATRPAWLSSDRLESALQTILPWCAISWCLGVSLLTLRLFAGVLRVRHWRNEGTPVKSLGIQEAFDRLIQRMSIRLPVTILESTHAFVPMVVGWFRPVVLLPPSLIANLTPAELESILAHELAHVRRLDQLVNLLQSITETLLFYHPAVWWISRRIRVEREHCCDDVAVLYSGSSLVFARALTRLEESRTPQKQLALAANSSALVSRIERLINVEPAPMTTAWPFSLLAIGMMAVIATGIWMNSATGADTIASDQDPVAVESTSPTVELPRQDQPTTVRHETTKKDSKTGVDQRVLTDILLAVEAKEKHEAKVDMKYSNVIRYSFIPAKIAKALGAVNYGTIDFGEQDPNNETPQTFDLNWETLRQLDAGGDLSDSGTVQLGILDQPPRQLQDTRPARVHLNELDQPLDEGQSIVPYGDDPLWVPGHLGFYGMNSTKQTKFQVVKIDQVSLGIGPSIGPVFALVNADENSDFGLLGSDWARAVRGEKGEGLWFAADGSIRFMPPPKRYDEVRTVPINPTESGTIVRAPVVDNAEGDVAPDLQDEITVLQEKQYNLSRRASTGWVKVDGANVPIDGGVRHGQTEVYVTLMYDVVAVDAETQEVKWHLDWSKLDPIWNRVRTVELSSNGNRQIAVELFGSASRNRGNVTKYLDLETGEELNIRRATDQDRNAIRLQVVAQENETIKRAVLKAIAEGRSAKDVAKAIQLTSRLTDGLGDSITMNETLVSAEDAAYIEHAIDAQQIIFNLPEGSGMRAEFSGEKIEFRNRDDGSTLIVINHGKVELIDSVGVVRAWASADGGAEQLVIECQFVANEFSLRMRTQRLQGGEDYPYPPVQCVMRPESGAPANEKQPPHGAVRYEVQFDSDTRNLRFKMMWRYDVERILREAAEAMGEDFDEYMQELRGENPGPQIDITPDRGNE